MSGPPEERTSRDRMSPGRCGRGFASVPSHPGYPRPGARSSGDALNRLRGGPVFRSKSTDPWVFYSGAGLVILFVAWGVLGTDSLASVTDSVLDWLLSSMGWVFVLSAAGFVAFAAYMGFSRYGTLRLGKDTDRPDFRTSSWIAMMFSAGMGIGLMFYAVAEPISHLGAPPLGLERA